MNIYRTHPKFSFKKMSLCNVFNVCRCGASIPIESEFCSGCTEGNEIGFGKRMESAEPKKPDFYFIDITKSKLDQMAPEVEAGQMLYRFHLEERLREIYKNRINNYIESEFKEDLIPLIIKLNQIMNNSEKHERSR